MENIQNAIDELQKSVWDVIRKEEEHFSFSKTLDSELEFVQTHSDSRKHGAIKFISEKELMFDDKKCKYQMNPSMNQFHFWNESVDYNLIKREIKN